MPTPLSLQLKLLGGLMPAYRVLTMLAIVEARRNLAWYCDELLIFDKGETVELTS